MAAVYSITTTHVRDGKYQDALERYRKLKGVIEKHGGTFHLRTQLYGATPLTLTTVVEVASWAKFGALNEQLGTDSDYQEFVASVRANPFGDIVQRAVLTDVPL